MTDTSLPCKDATLERFIRRKVKHQAQIQKELSHDEFLNFLLDKDEKGGLK